MADAEKAVEVVVPGVPFSLYYLANPDHAGVDIGWEVRVEVGRRPAAGWVVGVLSSSEAVETLGTESKKSSSEPALGALQLSLTIPLEQRRPKLKIAGAGVPVFLPEQLPLFRWMSEYYGAALGEVIENAVPARREQRKLLFAGLTEQGRGAAADAAQLESLRAPLQKRVLAALAESGGAITPSELEQMLGGAVRAALKALEKKGLIELTSAAREQTQFGMSRAEELLFSNIVPDQLTQHQQKAIASVCRALEEKTFSPFLLYGVTGSGKTEVYLRAVRKALEQSRGALVVLPEIALTPQFIDQFRARLDVPVALLHSQVGGAARWEAWEALLEGRVRVALGARSAVFAPLPELGLIIIDEEHESSYKQSDGLRYNARDVAVMRAKLGQAAAVLGSATPSFESLVNAQRRRYRILELPERATVRPLPELQVVDLSAVKRKEMPSENISPALCSAVQQTLAAGGQVIILYNRRGFASFLQCQSCSEVVTCPECSVALTLHKKRRVLLCHYCGLRIEPPEYCRLCRDPRTSRVETDEDGQPLERKSVVEAFGRLVERGSGTEKVVDELAVLFPQARIIRMDRDSVDEKGAYRRILSAMRSGEADILVGTQMIAKGHDLPGVTLVGIICADIGLHLPDFRSSERSYQLITQASGRCGRGKEAGRVIVQTWEPKHPTIVATATGRFKAFARYELDFRQRLGYPPFGRLLRLVVSSPDREEGFLGAQLVGRLVHDFARSLESPAGRSSAAAGDSHGSPAFAESGASPSPETPAPAESELPAQTAGKKAAGQRTIAILGPAPAPHEKLRGRYRWHILVKSPSAAVISRLAAGLNQWRAGRGQFKDLRLAVDVDPMDML